MQSLKYDQAARLSERYRSYSLFRVYYQNDSWPGNKIIQEFIKHFCQYADIPELAEGIQLLKTADKSKEDEAVYEYNTLFVGPKRLLAPPYEGAYRNAERTLMQRETLAVRQFYARAGLEGRQKNMIPDDHLAIELEFICYLLARAGKYIENGYGQKAKVYLEVYRDFFNRHLEQWVYQHCQDILQYAKTPACRGVALVMLGFLAQEKRILN